MALTHIQITKAKPRDKSYKLFDSGGLYLLVNPTGSKCWRLKYRFNNKEYLLSFGQYPDVTLAEAREARDKAKKFLAQGLDPSEIKKTKLRQDKEEAANTFESVALEWHEKHKVKWVKKTADRTMSMLKRHIFPFIGSTAMSKLKPAALLCAIQKIESRGNIETAHRALQVCGQISRFAIATDRASMDLSSVLKGALTPVKVKHHSSITDPDKVGQLLLDIDNYEGAYLTQQALQLAPLVFVRPGELRHAEWAEIDFEKKEWKIPGEKMKMRLPHIVPLSKQVLVILKDLHGHTGHLQYLFPGAVSVKRPMSENTVNVALKRMGYKDKHTAHGFRSTASTILHEQGLRHDVIELQLAHKIGNQVSAAYNYATYLPERQKMMQHWADYLDGLRGGTNVVSINGKII